MPENPECHQFDKIITNKQTDQKVKEYSIKEAIDLFKTDNKLEILSLDKFGGVCYSNVIGHLEHSEEIYEIFHDQSTFPIKATKHHSVFVWDKGDIFEKEVKDMTINDYLISFSGSNNLKKKTGSFEWSYTFNRKICKSKINITLDLMLLLGYYLAEGHITKSIHQIGFTFNRNEEFYITDCIRLLKKITKRNISIRHPNINSTQILIHSKEWYYFFKKICGKGAKGKHVPSFTWSLPKNYFIQLLLGYIRGDGHKTGEYSITTKSVSHKLIKEFVWLCKLNNLSCSINQDFSREHLMPQGTLFKVMLQLANNRINDLITNGISTEANLITQVGTLQHQNETLQKTINDYEQIKNTELNKLKVLVCSDDLSQSKPNPEGIIESLKQIGISSSECIYVGDHINDLKAGINAGTKIIACYMDIHYPIGIIHIIVTQLMMLKN